MGYSTIDITKRYVYMENKTLKDHHRKSGCIDKFLKRVPLLNEYYDG